MDCLFCKFVKGELEVKKIFEDENMIIIRDISPKAKNHFLLIPKSHYALFSDMTEEDSEVFGKCIMKIPSLSEVLELDGGYRIIVNQGENAGQTVHHVHVHILSGQKMDWNPA